MSTSAAVADNELGFWKFTLRCLMEGTREFYAPLLAFRRWWVDSKRDRRERIAVADALSEMKAVATNDNLRLYKQIGELSEMVAALTMMHERDQVVKTVTDSANLEMLELVNRITEMVEALSEKNTQQQLEVETWTIQSVDFGPRYKPIGTAFQPIRLHYSGVQPYDQNPYPPRSLAETVLEFSRFERDAIFHRDVSSKAVSLPGEVVLLKTIREHGKAKK